MEPTRSSEGATEFRVGDWQVHPSRDVLVRNGEQVKIEPKTMEVLVRLALRAGAVVPQSEIESEVWKGLVVTPQSVYQAVAQLRRVLGDSPRSPQYIETVPRRGYRLVAPVEWGARSDPENRPDAAPHAKELPPVATEASAGRSAFRRHRWTALAAIALLLLLVGWHYRATLFPQNTQSIAVLGFEDLSPDGSQAYLTQVLVEEVTSALGQVDGLKVAARDSARAASASGATVADIGRQLGVRHVLRGNVRREGDRIRVAAVLVETGTGYEAWSRSFERPASAVSRLPADIAALVARAVGLALVGDPGVRGGRTSTRSPIAYDYYMLGLQRFSERTVFALSEARRYFEQAIESDPTFAAAYVALADVHIAEFYFANRQLIETLDLVVPLIDKALALDPAFGPAVAMHGWIALERGDFARAQADLEQAIELSPNDAKARLWLSTVLFASAHPRQALVELDKALELDPLNFVAHLRRALILDALGQHDEASEAADRAVTLAPKHPNPRWTLALIETSRGRIASAIAHYQAALTLDASRSDLRVHLATLLLDAGREADARRELAEAIRLAQSSHADLTARAYLALLDGDLEGLAAAAEAIASVEPRNRYLTMDAANFMTLAGRHSDALQLFERALAEYPESLLHDLWMIRWGMESSASCLAVVYAVVGLEDERDRLVGSIERFIDDARDRGLRYWGLEYLAAAMAAVAGDPTRAISYLERASEAGWRRVWWARQDPALASLHEQPDFDSLLERTAAQAGR